MSAKSYSDPTCPETLTQPPDIPGRRKLSTTMTGIGLSGRRRGIALLLPAGLMLAALLASQRPPTGARAAAQTAPSAPSTLTDREFWQLVTGFSEPGGTFHSENYLSNEGEYQTVIPDLVARVRPGGIYLGVGPEQNFTYITAIRPRMAFIVDIRRGNLQEHLLYKALMEMSSSRADFVSRLFARRVPATIGVNATAHQLFEAAAAAPASEAMFRESVAAVLARLATTHGFAITQEDRVQIEFIYRRAFFEDGPSMMYQRTDGRSAGRRPTYAELMTMEDGRGKNWSYLATEASFMFLKNLQTRNLLVPIVGDFGGPKALRSVGRYAADHGMTVAAFYLSNVEQYLGGKYEAFCASVASMPLDASSTYIRSQSRGSYFTQHLGVMREEAPRCAGGGR
jgi:hypothetical protein